MSKIHGCFECMFYYALRFVTTTRTLLHSVKNFMQFYTLITMVNVSITNLLKNQIRYIAVPQFVGPIEIVYS